MGEACLQSLASKEAGNAALKANDLEAADAHYTAALEALPGNADCESQLLRATLLCNRAHTRHLHGEPKRTIEDATEALQLLQPSAPCSDRLRIKALYRRALSREQLGELQGAFEDLNLALRLTPSSSGIIEAAQRLKASLPPSASREAQQTKRPPPHVCPLWEPLHLFNTKDVMRIVDSKGFPGRCLGFTMLGSDPTVRFASGMGVTAHHGDGGLAAIWPLGAPRQLPRTQQLHNGLVQDMPGVPEVGEDWFRLPNMEPGDGFHVMYGRSGDLRWISFRKSGELHGSRLRFDTSGTLVAGECAVFQHGELVEKWQDSLLPKGFIEQALMQVAIPVKKALGIGLSFGERRLCAELEVNIDAVEAARPPSP